MQNVEKVLISRKEILKKVEEIAVCINNDYRGKELFMVGVLKGATIFLADLIRFLTIPLEIDYMAVSSYGDSTKTSGVVKILKDLDQNISGKEVMIVEDIVDTGLTLQFLINTLKQRGPSSLKITTLLDKPDRRKVNVDVNYSGFQIPDIFVVGYGLDFKGKYRNLPDVCILEVTT